MVDEDWILLPEAEKKLDELDLSFNEKVEWIARYIRSLESNIKQLTEEKNQLDKKMKTNKNKVERMKNWIQFNFEKRKIEKKMQFWIFTVWFSKSKKLHIENESLVPDEFMKIEKTPKKTEITQAIKNWEEVDFAEIRENKSLSIKV